MNRIFSSISESLTFLFTGLGLAETEQILSIISFVVAIIIGIAGIVMKVIIYKKNDGKLDTDELKDIQEDIEELKGKIDKNE